MDLRTWRLRLGIKGVQTYNIRPYNPETNILLNRCILEYRPSRVFLKTWEKLIPTKH